MVSVYVSSTYAVISALRRMNHHVVCMEKYGAADQRPLERCLRDVDQCDVYVGIFAWQYGYAPQEDNPAGRSITELEYRRARDAKKQCLMWFAASHRVEWKFRRFLFVSRARFSRRARNESGQLG